MFGRAKAKSERLLKNRIYHILVSELRSKRDLRRPIIDNNQSISAWGIRNITGPTGYSLRFIVRTRQLQPLFCWLTLSQTKNFRLFQTERLSSKLEGFADDKNFKFDENY